MNTISFDSTALASRAAARLTRVRAAETLKASGRVNFDLSSVYSISGSYADELFGVLARDLGFEQFRCVVRLHAASDEVLKSIAVAVARRVPEPRFDNCALV